MPRKVLVQLSIKVSFAFLPCTLAHTAVRLIRWLIRLPNSSPILRVLDQIDRKLQE